MVRADLTLPNLSKVSEFGPKLESLHHQPWSNVHGHQLLEQQLRSIRKFHLIRGWGQRCSRILYMTFNSGMGSKRRISFYLRDLGFVLAALALKGVVAQICNSNQTTQVAHMEPKIFVKYESWGEKPIFF